MFLIPLFKKIKHWDLDIIGYRVTEAGCEIEKDVERGLLARVPRIVQKIPENYCPCLYLLIGEVW